MYFGYFDYLPAEEGNPWYEDQDYPTDEELAEIEKEAVAV